MRLPTVRRRPRLTPAPHLPAARAGSRPDGLDLAEVELRRAMDTSVPLRRALPARPLERSSEPATDRLAPLVAHRLDLTRHLVDRGLSPPGVSGLRGGT
jgi:hypothetical protein